MLIIIFLCLFSEDCIIWLCAKDITHFSRDLYSKPLSHLDPYVRILHRAYISYLYSGDLHEHISLVHLWRLQTNPTTHGNYLIAKLGLLFYCIFEHRCQQNSYSTDMRSQVISWLLTCYLNAQAALMGTYSPIASSKYTPVKNSKYTVDHIYHQKVDCRPILKKTPISYIYIPQKDGILKTRMQKGQQCDISGTSHKPHHKQYLFPLL